MSGSDAFVARSVELSDEASACPICQETFLTLAQLNQHLDDAHSNSDKYDSTKRYEEANTQTRNPCLTTSSRPRSLFSWFDYAKTRVIAPIFERAKDAVAQQVPALSRFSCVLTLALVGF